jgi:hypothetical protein
MNIVKKKNRTVHYHRCENLKPYVSGIDSGSDAMVDFDIRQKMYIHFFLPPTDALIRLIVTSLNSLS